MDTVQEAIIFLTWTIRDWYLLTELFQITVINCKLALAFSLENPVFLSDFQLSQPFLALIYPQTAGVAGIFSPWFCILCDSGIVQAFVGELWDRQQQREQTVWSQDPSPSGNDPFAVVDGIPLAHSHTDRGFMGAPLWIQHLPKV